jgi:azurin
MDALILRSRKDLINLRDTIYLQGMALVGGLDKLSLSVEVKLTAQGHESIFACGKRTFPSSEAAMKR